MSSIRELKKAKTQAERDRLESSLGVRFSNLCEIDYFILFECLLSIRCIIYFKELPKKKMMKLWLGFKVIHPDQLVTIQERVDSVDAASNIVAIPRKIASSFGGFTAE